MEQTILFGEPKELTEVAPRMWARKAPEIPHEPEDESVLCSWVRSGVDENGTPVYKPVPDARFAKITARLCAALGVSYETIRRLANAGFVEIRQPSPDLFLLDLDSWRQHLDNTDPNINPEFWAPGKRNRNHYLFVNALGGYNTKDWKDGE